MITAAVMLNRMYPVPQDRITPSHDINLFSKLWWLHAFCHLCSRLFLLLTRAQPPLFRGIVANLKLASSKALEHSRTELIARLLHTQTMIALLVAPSNLSVQNQNHQPAKSAGMPAMSAETHNCQASCDPGEVIGSLVFLVRETLPFEVLPQLHSASSPSGVQPSIQAKHPDQGMPALGCQAKLLVTARCAHQTSQSFDSRIRYII